MSENIDPSLHQTENPASKQETIRSFADRIKDLIYRGEKVAQDLAAEGVTVDNAELERSGAALAEALQQVVQKQGMNTGAETQASQTLREEHLPPEPSPDKNYTDSMADRDQEGMQRLLTEQDTAFDHSSWTKILRGLANASDFPMGRKYAERMMGDLEGKLQDYAAMKRKLMSGEKIAYLDRQTGQPIDKELTSPDQLTPALYADTYSLSRTTMDFHVYVDPDNTYQTIQDQTKVREAIGIGGAWERPVKTEWLAENADFPDADRAKPGVLYVREDKNSSENYTKRSQENAARPYGERATVVTQEMYFADPSKPEEMLLYSQKYLKSPVGETEFIEFSICPADIQAGHTLLRNYLERALS